MMMTDTEAGLRLLKIVYEFEAVGLSFVDLLAQTTKARVDRSTRASCPP
jgi:hypothetical protein